MKKYRVTLTSEERDQLNELISKGKSSSLQQRRARLLLKADEAFDGPAWTDQQISDALEITTRMCERVREQFVEEGFEASLGRRKSSRTYRRKLDGDAEAHLVALVCHKEPPEGYARWSLRLLADRLVEMEVVESMSHEGVRRALKKMNLSLGRRNNGAFPPRAMPSL